MSLIELTTQEADKRGLARVGVLASPTTIKTKLYENPLVKAGLVVGVPTLPQQMRVENLIRQTIAGDISLGSKLQKELEILQKGEGVDQVILGCTELSVIANKTGIKRVIDPLAVVVDEIFGYNKDKYE